LKLAGRLHTPAFEFSYSAVVQSNAAYCCVSEARKTLFPSYSLRYTDGEYEFNGFLLVLIRQHLTALV